jgi:hypothetical protein
MSNTPAAPAQRAEASVRTWVKSQQQLHPKPGHFSAAFNTLAFAGVILILAEALDPPKFTVLPEKPFLRWIISKK